MANQQADFLVIGSGLAGLNAAIELSEHGSVLLLSKVQLGEVIPPRTSGIAWSCPTMTASMPMSEIRLRPVPASVTSTS